MAATLYKVEEDRTYTCLQQDRSISLEDLTPERLDDPDYWRAMSYNVGEQFEVTEEHIKDPAVVADQQKVLPGIYTCISADNDIKDEKVTVESGKLPLTFSRQATVYLGEQQIIVYPWAQKWQKVDK